MIKIIVLISFYMLTDVNVKSKCKRKCKRKRKCKSKCKRAEI